MRYDETSAAPAEGEAVRVYSAMVVPANAPDDYLVVALAIDSDPLPLSDLVVARLQMLAGTIVPPRAVQQ